MSGGVDGGGGVRNLRSRRNDGNGRVVGGGVRWLDEGINEARENEEELEELAD